LIVTLHPFIYKNIARNIGEINKHVKQ